MKAFIDKNGVLQISAETQKEVNEIENWLKENRSELNIDFNTEISYCYNSNQHNEKKCLKQCKMCQTKQTMYKK